MASDIRVGIIGANANGGWAGEAHVPAVQGLPGMTLAAIATSSQETADKAAHVFGVDKAYGSGLALIADPDIDVVTVATRVQDHAELLLAAIAAGKHVYSEWPLGAGASQAQAIADAAASAGVRNAIGLQLRGSPAVAQASAIIRSGSLGRILSISVLSTTAGFGPRVPSQFEYLESPANFANLVTIQGAHTLDLIFAIRGRPDRVATFASRQFPDLEVGEPAERRRRVTFDHLLVQGRLVGGTPFTVEVAGGRGEETPFHLDIIGEKGSLRLDGGAPRGVQSSRVGLLHDGKRVTIDEGEQAGLPDGALNVAGIYTALRDDILEGSSSAVGFAHAVGLTRLIEGVLASPNGEALDDNSIRLA